MANSSPDSTYWWHLISFIALSPWNTLSVWLPEHSVFSPHYTPGASFALTRVWQTVAFRPNPALCCAPINKALWEHSHGHSFTYRLWLLSCYSEWQDWVGNRDQLAHKAKTIYYEALHEENFLTTGVDSFGTLVFLLPHQPLLVFFASSFHLLGL